VAVRPVEKKELKYGPAGGRKLALNWSSGEQGIRAALDLLQRLGEVRIVFGGRRGARKIRCLLQAQAPTEVVGRKQMGLDVAYSHLHLEDQT
jgi:hypothetical protein